MASSAAGEKGCEGNTSAESATRTLAGWKPWGRASAATTPSVSRPKPTGRAIALPRRCPAPSQPSTATSTTENPAQAMAKPVPPSRLVSHSRARVVSPSGSAIALRNQPIHAPGRGSIARSGDTKAMARNGSAMPRPSAANSASAAPMGSSSAAPIAPAMNGPVQGVATKAASSPVAKALFLAPPACAKPGTLNSKSPARLAVITTHSANSATTTPGSCS